MESGTPDIHAKLVYGLSIQLSLQLFSVFIYLFYNFVYTDYRNM